MGCTFPFSSTVARGLNALSRSGSSGVVVVFGPVVVFGVVVLGVVVLGVAVVAVPAELFGAAGTTLSTVGDTAGADAFAGAMLVD